MKGISNYQAYQNNYGTVKNDAKAKNAAGKNQAAKKEEPKDEKEVYIKSKAVVGMETQGVPLSAKAKALLERLKDQYGDMDFTIANYDSEEEASRLMQGGTKRYHAVIEPELLEKMAADEKVGKKFETIISDSCGKLSDMSKELGDDAGKVKNLGVSVDKDGNVSYFAELQRQSANQKEQMDAAREKKAEQAELLEKSKKRKSVFVRADTIEELLKKIREADLSEKEEKTSGIDIRM